MIQLIKLILVAAVRDFWQCHGWKAIILLIVGAIIFSSIGRAEAAPALSDVVGAVTGVASGAASGGLLGLAGSAVGGVFKWLRAKQELVQKEKLWAHELKLQELNLKAKSEETEQEILLADSRGSWQSLDASINADAATSATAPPWATGIKTLFRPVLTLLLLALSGIIIYWLMQGNLPDMIGSQTAERLLIYGIEAVVFSTSTAIVWWFGDRSFAPHRFK